ncbi:MAG: hypothetical protein GX786_11080 [Clostridiales bacterium]|nr:hypothetical protein [Clostridiales bacterium]
MADIFDTLKKTWIKTIEVVGDTANTLADSAKNKVNEMNLSTSRKELVAHCGNLAYELWLQGEAFPEALISEFETLKDFDDQLESLRLRKEENAAKHDVDQAPSEEELVAQTKEVLKDLENKEESEDSSVANPQEPEMPQEEEQATQESPQES